MAAAGCRRGYLHFLPLFSHRCTRYTRMTSIWRCGLSCTSDKYSDLFENVCKNIELRLSIANLKEAI